MASCRMPQCHRWRKLCCRLTTLGSGPKFGLAKLGFGQSWFWPKLVWPKLATAQPSWHQLYVIIIIIGPATRYVVQHAWDAFAARTLPLDAGTVEIGTVDSTSAGTVSAVTGTRRNILDGSPWNHIPPVQWAHQRFIIRIRIYPSQPEFQTVQNVVRNITHA